MKSQLSTQREGARRVRACHWLYSCFAICLGLMPGSAFIANRAFAAESSAPSLGTGIHWATPSEYATLKLQGYDFAVVTVPANDPPSWKTALDAAEASGLKLVIGANPPPYSFNTVTRQWTITYQGHQFLQYLAARPARVAAVFVFNEPYWTNPLIDGQTSACGVYSAAELRALRTEIRKVWPAALIYHDLGMPSAWAPGGAVWTSCVGDKYADQTGVADYAAVWHYPFRTTGYDKPGSLALVQRELAYVTRSMAPAAPVVLGQSFTCAIDAGCENPPPAFPTQAQIKDWNCALRGAGVTSLSWYVWRQDPLYTDYLSRHAAYWPETLASACSPPDTTAPSVPGNLSWAPVHFTSMTLTWNESADNIAVTGYRLDVSLNSGFTSYLSGYQDRNMGTAVSATAAGLTEGTTYYARVRAYDAAGNVSSDSTPPAQGLTRRSPSGASVPAVTLTKSASPATAAVGAIVTFTIQYQNIGSSAASHVVITDDIPAGATLVTGSITGGGTASGGTLTWMPGTVASGASGSVSFQVRVN